MSVPIEVEVIKGCPETRARYMAGREADQALQDGVDFWTVAFAAQTAAEATFSAARIGNAEPEIQAKLSQVRKSAMAEATYADDELGFWESTFLVVEQVKQAFRRIQAGANA